MKALIVYDSMHGNTEKIARSIGDALAGEVRVLRAGEARPSELEGVDLLIVGSPTQGGRPTQPVQDFLNGAPLSVLKGIKVAAFDTRLSTRFVGVFGYAAKRIADGLKKKGVDLVLPPEGFFVRGREGPLKEGEVERAAGWARKIVERMV